MEEWRSSTLFNTPKYISLSEDMTLNYTGTRDHKDHQVRKEKLYITLRYISSSQQITYYILRIM